MNEKNNNLNELADLVNKFMDFADQLKLEGRISEEQYEYMTKSKVEFLKETSEIIYNPEKKTIEKDLFY